jgi:FkbM family methyltransferase
MRRFRYWIKKHLAWMRIPILGGPLKGHWIGANCGMRFIRGDYDHHAARAIASAISPGMVVYDIGAHVGYLSMLAARGVGPSGRVIAFEPLDLNLRYLRGHVRANRIENIAVVAACVSQHPGTTAFDLGKGSGRGRLMPGTDGSMRTVSIDDEVLSERLPAPSFIKMDVEGAELMALRGAEKTLRTYRPSLLLSVHGPQLREECSRFLHALGYELSRVRRDELMAVWSGARTLATVAYGFFLLALVDPLAVTGA